ncbi:synaptonemal complex protein 2 isoform X1 [Ornithorhynchus anatinus]|uniref:Synaptonemal complex protein 2 n=1 Tax=Ornithorhynchus anatinus TaxID=9258 RepID=F7EJ03_ORNAN|nr:synaptonemal complex protein 2 isoform X1 [Ornithorhynchus anatinus]
MRSSILASDAKNFQKHTYETTNVSENEVEVYNLEVKNARKLLTLTLKNTITICKKEGKQIKLYFDAASDILDITQRIYGTEKYKGFIRKQAISTAKSTVHVIFGEEQSQMLVPGGHSSLVEEQKANRREPLAVAIGVTNQEDSRYIQHQGITPKKVKMSQAVTVICNKHRFPDKSTKESSKKSSQQKKGTKLPSKVLNSVERTSTPKRPQKRGTVAKISELIQNDAYENIDGLLDAMSESVAVPRKNKPLTERKSPINTENIMMTSNLNNESCAKGPAIAKYAEGPRKSGRVMTSEFNDHNWEIKEMKNKAMEGEFNAKAALFLNKINDRYIQQEELAPSRKAKVPLAENRTCLNKSDLPLSKEKLMNKSSRQQVKTTSINVLDCVSSDIYDFNVNGSDDPTIKLQTKREQEKKQSFRDKDSDQRGGDRNGDSRWPKESNQNLKQQQIECSGNKTAENPKHLVAKKPSPSPVLPVEKEQLQPTKAPVYIEVDETIEAPVAKRSRRATITTKNYKDLSNSESGSEQKSSLKFISNENNSPEKENFPTQSEAMQSKNLQDIVSPHLKDGKESPKISDYEKEVHLEVSANLLAASPSSIEKMRCAEKVTDGSYTQEYDHSIKASQLYQQNSAPEKEPLNQPNVTQVIMDKIVRNANDTEVLVPALEATINSEDDSSCSLEGNLRESEQKTHINVSQNTGEESVLPFEFSMLSRKRKKPWDASLEDVHESEPIKSPTLTRRYPNDGQSDYGEVEMREDSEAAEPSVLPKKLFKPADTASISHKVSDRTSTMSRNDVSIPGEEWESDYSNIGSQQFSKEFQTHSSKVEDFTKKSLELFQHHMTRISSQIFKYRMKELHDCQLIFKAEMERFEKDIESLINLENEFLDYLKKNFERFSVCQESEQLRVTALKNAMETFFLNTAEQEKNIFTTEMELMREGLNALRESFLKEIASACKEEDVLHIRRGVMSLLMQIEEKL